MTEITIPVLNEEKKLKQNVLKLHDYLSKDPEHYGKWTVVIADNGSTDRTRSIGEKLAIENDWLTYIRVDERGVGIALQKSWMQSNASIIGYLDLDLATNLKHLKDILPALDNGYDLVYASRLHRQSKVTGRSFTREITSRSFNILVRSYMGVHFSDGMCGFKFMKREVFEKLYIAGAKSHGWFFSTELLILAEWNHYKLFELPVEWNDSGESHVRIIPLTLEYLKSLKALKKYKPGYSTNGIQQING